MSWGTNYSEFHFETMSIATGNAAAILTKAGEVVAVDVSPECYGHGHAHKLPGYTDADWAGNMDDRKSTSGGCFYIGNNLIAWLSVPYKPITHVGLWPCLCFNGFEDSLYNCNIQELGELCSTTRFE